MSKERLEKAKKILNHIKGYGVYDGNDDIEIFEWLIEQAEQKQSLETAVDFYQSALRDADRRVQELEEERDECKETAQSYYMTNQALREENKRYREMLEKIKEMTRYDDCREAEIYELVSDELEGEK